MSFRSTDLDDTAPPPSPLFDLSSSLEVVGVFPESYSSSFCLLTCLPFLSICLFVQGLIFKSSYFVGMVIIGRRKSKSTFGANNTCNADLHFVD